MSVCAGDIRPQRLAFARVDAQGEVQAHWLDAQGQLTPNPELLKHPQRLGSLWKLVAYAQWVESRVPESPYRCTGKLKEEMYCCTPGEAITRVQALVRSCGLYFSVQRVPWSAPAGLAMAALPTSLQQALERQTLGPQTQVRLEDWLTWLAQWPAPLRSQAQTDLLGYWVDGPGKDVIDKVAGQLRVKTFTLDAVGGTRYAGGSGWTMQGVPIWFGQAGSSKRVVPQWAFALTKALSDTAAQWPTHLAEPSGMPCVRVNYFSQYPVESIKRQGAADLAVGYGRLKGTYQLSFRNGRALIVESQGDLHWQPNGAASHITGEYGLDEYVARVVDREARATPTQAAWAFAIAARTYALAQGENAAGCLVLDDASRTQRVAPRPASRGAWQAALATSGLVLTPAYPIPGRYHADKAEDGVLSWREAVAQAEAGSSFMQILQHAYPRASLRTASQDAAVSCDALPQAQAWLQLQQKRWRMQLAGMAGYTEPTGVSVCLLKGGRPHAQNSIARIDVSGFASLEQRLALTHEYLHLAFAHHPRSQDEGFIETLARRLMGLTEFP